VDGSSRAYAGGEDTQVLARFPHLHISPSLAPVFVRAAITGGSSTPVPPPSADQVSSRDVKLATLLRTLPKLAPGSPAHAAQLAAIDEELAHRARADRQVCCISLPPPSLTPPTKANGSRVRVMAFGEALYQ